MIKYKKYQTAGNTKKLNKPIIVNDINDERYKAYRDSSDLYNFTKLQKQLEKPSDFVPTTFLEMLTNWGRTLKESEEGKRKRDIVTKNAQEILKNNENLRTGLFRLPDAISKYEYDLYGSYDIHHPNIKPKGEWRGTAVNNDYSNVEPVQPVEYRPKTVTNKKVTSPPKKRIIDPSIVAKQKLIGTTPDGIWGPKSEEAWKQYQNRNIIPPIQSTPAPVVNNPQIINTPAQVIKPKSPKFKFVDDYTGPTYEMSKQDEIDFYNQRKKQYGGNLKYQVAGRTQLNKEFIEGVSNSKPKKTINKPDLYNNPTEIDNTKVNYQQAPIVYKTYPQNVNGKTVNVPTNQGTISQGNPDTFKDTLYNRSKNSKTFNNLANNLIVPITNIAGGLEGANLIKQGVKNIIKRIPKKVPLKVNDISNEIRLYNNTPTDNYKAIIDKGTNPIISKDIPDEPYERIFHRKYTHGNPDDMHKIIRVNNENINGFANSLSHINNEEDMEPLLKNIIKKYNKENHPNEKGGLNYKPDWLQSIMEKGKQRKPFAKRPNLNTQKSEMSFNFENMINNNHLSKIYKDLERRNIDISNINRIKNNLYKFDDIE